jgi:hypothetical protein
VQARGAQQRAEVVGEGHVAEVGDNARTGGRGPKGGGQGPVDAVGAAVGEHAGRSVAGGPEGLDVAHRHGGGGEDGHLGRQSGQGAGHGGL